MIRAIAALAVFLIAHGAYAQVTVHLQNLRGESLAGVHLVLVPQGLVQVTDAGGMAKLPVYKPGDYHIVATLVGYETREMDTALVPNTHVVFRLLRRTVKLDEMIIMEEHAKLENSKSVVHLGGLELHESHKQTLSATLGQVVGLQYLQTGTGISKPVIRGLTGNRIAVNQGGVRQEGQQWGQDHGLEMDQFDVDEVEIIKGASALQYGADATGGVINVPAFPLLAHKEIRGSMDQVAEWNNHLLGTSLALAGAHRGFTLSARFSTQSFGDYSLPANSFLYNGFELPLYHGKLKNTAGREQHFRIGVGMLRGKSSYRLWYAKYGLISGLFAGAVGIPTSYNLLPDGNDRDIDLPMQAVRHHRLGFSFITHWKNGHLSIDAAIQRNLRQEHAWPEFQNLPFDSEFRTLAQQFDLRTYAANAHYERDPKNGIKQVLGAGFQVQHNLSDGFDYLLPDFGLSRAGGYYLIERTWVEGAGINGALRVDAGLNSVNHGERVLYNSQGDVLDSLLFSSVKGRFAGWSAAVGAHSPAGSNFQIKANLSRSFRMPYANEMASNGIHHGTFRHEQGNADLRQETGLHLDGSVLYSTTRHRAELSLWGSAYQGFIYLAPSGKFSYLPEAGQVYAYYQDNTWIWGGEVEHVMEIFEHLELLQGAEAVFSQVGVTGRSLPFNPPFSMYHRLEWEKLYGKNTNRVSLWLMVDQVLAQQRTARNEPGTPGYILAHTGLGGRVALLNKGFIHWSLRVNNLFNTPYLNHMSRYRALNLPEQGRNLLLGIHIKFHENG